MINEIFIFPSLLTTERNFYKETHFFNYRSDSYLQFQSPPSITCSGEISHVARRWLVALLISEVTDCASSVREYGQILEAFHLVKISRSCQEIDSNILDTSLNIFFSFIVHFIRNSPELFS